MKIEELLKDDKETLDKVNAAIEAANKNITDENKKIKYADLGEGGYVSAAKYTDLEGKLREAQNKPNTDEEKIKNLETQHADALKQEKEKLSAVVRRLAVDSEIASLGLTDELTKAGFKSMIDMSKITLNEDYTVSGGLQDQIKTLKETYKDSFAVKTVSTGSSKPAGNTKTGRVYSSRAEIEALSQEEIMSDMDNIMKQLSKLK